MVSCCSDGDVVGVGEGDGGGFGERRKRGRKVGGRGGHAFVECAVQREHHCMLDRDKAGADQACFQVVDRTIRSMR